MKRMTQDIGHGFYAWVLILQLVLPKDLLFLSVGEHLSFLEGKKSIVSDCLSFFKAEVNGWLGRCLSGMSSHFGNSHDQAPPLQMLLVLTKAEK